MREMLLLTIVTLLGYETTNVKAYNIVSSNESTNQTRKLKQLFVLWLEHLLCPYYNIVANLCILLVCRLEMLQATSRKHQVDQCNDILELALLHK